MILDKKFFRRNDTVAIAEELLGKVIVTNIDKKKTSGIIVETEAYKAPEDLACHAHGNKLTPRTKGMFLPGGMAYVYICYGIHNLFNIVTGPEGEAHVILIRAVEPLENISLMMKRRKFKNQNFELLNGPGKLSSALGITMDHNSVDLTSGKSPIRIEDHNISYQKSIISSGPRVGMSASTKHCGHYPWRFKVDNNKWVSKPLTVKYDW